jgi:hypothetical protein
MNGSLVITIMGAANALLALTIIALLLRDRRAGMARYIGPVGTLSEILLSPVTEHIESTADSLPEQPAKIAASVPRTDDYSAIVKMALELLEKGADPRIVAREFEFSQAEIEVLKAGVAKLESNPKGGRAS